MEPHLSGSELHSSLDTPPAARWRLGGLSLRWDRVRLRGQGSALTRSRVDVSTNATTDVFHRPPGVIGENRKHLRGGCPPPTQQYQLITYCTARTATGARGVTPRNTREISVPELVVINAKCACVSACGSTAAELHVRGVQHGAEWCPVIWCADALSQHSQHAWPRGPLRGSGPRPPGG